MNSKVLLKVFLLGVLCIIGCARAYLITLKDAKQAIDHGWRKYTMSLSTFSAGASFEITLEQKKGAKDAPRVTV